MASLALDLRAAGAFRESVNLLRETWEKYRDVLGDDMTETLLAATSLAVSLRKAGEQAEAMTLAQDTYERYKRRYGSESPDSQSCASTWPATTRPSTTCHAAWTWSPGSGAALQASLGDEHPNTLVAANNLACYLRCHRPAAGGAEADRRHARPDAAQPGREPPADPVLRGQPGQLPG